MGFTLAKTSADLMNAKLGREKHDNENVIGMDLKIKINIDADDIKPLVGGDDIVGALWDKNGYPRYRSINHTTFDVEFKEHAITLAKKKYNNVDLKNFRVAALENKRAELIFTIRVHPDGKEEIGELGFSLNTPKIALSIISNELPLEGGKNPDPDKPKKPAVAKPDNKAGDKVTSIDKNQKQGSKKKATKKKTTT